MRIKDYGQLVEFTSDVYCEDCDKEYYDMNVVEVDGLKEFKCPGCETERESK